VTPERGEKRRAGAGEARVWGQLGSAEPRRQLRGASPKGLAKVIELQTTRAFALSWLL
jgi:hypothetical protein